MTSPVPDQSSHEGDLELSSSPELVPDDRSQALARFREIINHCEPLDREPNRYNRPRLVRLFYDHALSPRSRDNMLRACFKAIQLPMSGGSLSLSKDSPNMQLFTRVVEYGDYLFDNFIVPMQGRGNRPPLASPQHRSATSRSNPPPDFASTPGRLWTLRRDCLVRDEYQCVVSRSYEINEWKRTRNQNVDPSTLSYLECAHIIPHSLLHIQSSAAPLTERQRTTLDILNMFDINIMQLINGPDIDKTYNALMLTPTLHNAFGSYDIFFTPIPGRPNTYRIEAFHGMRFNNTVPVERELFMPNDPELHMPSPRLLAIHRAVAHIIHLSGAAEYIAKIFRDFDEGVVKCDGSTQLGHMLELRLRMNSTIT